MPYQECLGEIILIKVEFGDEGLAMKRVEAKADCVRCGEICAITNNDNEELALKLNNIVLGGVAEKKGCFNPEELVRRKIIAQNQ